MWPNPYYQIAEEEIVDTPSSASIVTGVTTSGATTLVNPPSPPEELHQIPLPEQIKELLELPRIADYNRQVAALRTRVEERNRQIQQLSVPVTQKLEDLIAQIQSGVDLDEIAFTKGNITFCHLRDIDQNTNPQFYNELSQHVDDNYE